MSTSARRSAAVVAVAAVVALAVSMIGPSYLADGAAAVALMSMHLAVGVVPVRGFARFVARPSWTNTWAGGG